MSSFGTGCDHDRYASISQDWYNVITQSQPDYLSNGSSSDVRNVIKRPLKIFCTKDSYKGEWDALGMAGNGVYTFPHGSLLQIYLYYIKNALYINSVKTTKTCLKSQKPVSLK